MDNYMIIVINENGNFETFGEMSEYRFHIEALRDYFYTINYVLADKVDADNLEKNEEIIYYLNQMDKVIFLNSPGYGICYIPKSVNSKQNVSIQNLFDVCEDKAIYIEYGLSKIDGKIVPEKFLNYTLDAEVKNSGKSI